MRIVATIVAAAALGSLCSTAVEAQAIQRIASGYLVVDHGRSIKLGSYSSLDPDCRSMGRTTLNLLTPPQGGQVEIQDGYDFPNFPSNNVRSACNRRRVLATLIFYKAAANFVGPDTFTVESVAPNGFSSQLRYVVNVR